MSWVGRCSCSIDLETTGLLAEVAANHALLSVILSDLADRLSWALVVLVARSDLNSSGASALSVLWGLGGDVWSWSWEGSWLAGGVPDADLGGDVEDGSWGTWHTLPSSAEQVIWSWLALEEVSAGLWVGGKWVNHPRADSLVLSVLDSGSLDEWAWLWLDNWSRLLWAVLLLSSSGLAVLLDLGWGALAWLHLDWSLSGGNILLAARDGDEDLLILLVVGGASACWLVLWAWARWVLRESEWLLLSGSADLLGSGDWLEDFRGWADTVLLSVGAGALSWSLADLFDEELHGRGSWAEIVFGGIGRLAKLLLFVDRTDSLTAAGRGNKLVSWKAFTEKPDSEIFSISSERRLTDTLNITGWITGGSRERWQLADIAKNGSPVLWSLLATLGFARSEGCESCASDNEEEARHV